MSLPALATLEALEVRLGGSLDDEDRAQAALDDASALVRSIAGKTWVTNDVLDTDIPDIIATITLRAARRAYTNPNDHSSETIGNSSVGFGAVYLTVEERSAVLAAIGNNGVSSVGLETPWSLIANDYIEVLGSDKPLPWSAP